jgi:phosphoribosyl-ATP pyrophosphohydrolase/phosphoribosyl-AMP cyclohydrolase
MIAIETINFDKTNGLVPCIIQHAKTYQVLMLGYMNKEALELTLTEKKVTFFSRSKNRLWTKGEESGNFLNFVSIELDCDQDTLLCMALPEGPTCHTGSTSCWNDEKFPSFQTIYDLEKTITVRWENEPEDSYVSHLKGKGIAKIAQKVGEEGVEVVIEALRNEPTLFLNESADLVFHLLILLKAKGFTLNDVLKVLDERKK